MNIYRKFTVVLTAVLVSTALLSGCAQLDVIAKVSIESFDQLVQASDVTLNPENNRWILTAPDDQSQFILSQNFADSKQDLTLNLDAEPFVVAGLDPSKLTSGQVVDGRLVISRDVSADSLQTGAKISVVDTYKQLLQIDRESLGYHQALDHYGLDLGQGNKFEWAKDLTTNDKDLVFVLDPAPFTAAGTDVTSIEGWLLADVEVMDDANKPIMVKKLLKPFELR
ncbi:MAG: hypothetical protein PHC86_07980 [Eubacteriales bacterium]|nr:hypothetical protein [Eubacteriales bacterium]